MILNDKTTFTVTSIQSYIKIKSKVVFTQFTFVSLSQVLFLNFSMLKLIILLFKSKTFLSSVESDSIKATHMPKGIKVVVCELQLLKGDKLSHPMGSCCWRVWMDIESSRHRRFCFSSHHPKENSKTNRQHCKKSQLISLSYVFKCKRNFCCSL